MASRSKFSTANLTITDADTWYPLPSMPVGEDCEVVIKSKGTNTGAVKVAFNSVASKAAPFLLDLFENQRNRTNRGVISSGSTSSGSYSRRINLWQNLER